MRIITSLILFCCGKVGRKKIYKAFLFLVFTALLPLFRAKVFLSGVWRVAVTVVDDFFTATAASEG